MLYPKAIYHPITERHHQVETPEQEAHLLRAWGVLPPLLPVDPSLDDPHDHDLDEWANEGGAHLPDELTDPHGEFDPETPALQEAEPTVPPPAPPLPSGATTRKRGHPKKAAPVADEPPIAEDPAKPLDPDDERNEE